jgi:hypothetical protein
MVPNTLLDSASSARSIHSTHSNTTVKATSPPTSHPTPTPSSSSSTAFPYTVGRLSTFHDADTEMDDPFSIKPTLGHRQGQEHGHGHQRHRIDSQGVPIPPARTSSLAHPSNPHSHTHSHSHSHSVSSSDTSLPSVQVTTATPTKSSSKHQQHPYQSQGQGHGQYDQYSSSFGHGSLDVTEDHLFGHGPGQGYTFPQYWSSTDQLTSLDDESDGEAEMRGQRLLVREMNEADKAERTRRQGRERQRRKRAKDKEEKVCLSLLSSSRS